ncbi:grasp-with-spasm system SPASM domain peptide maturase [Kordia sp. YSTF-M3]|uniref:Grasp-with-spasm system SPASM domain peptide maturase n=1 Tax=Kordia aestuariivivens TaxID=2759037 RepID=A0ABR7QF58_9FLAO|nr:grasp-with-spasm system SPASM domain peptide maturase [Kordia aestuariivivens]MBC8757138.1 grasp-with-spasm system SPASM domain peptide maturase [Kordia aestuariivivens]
MIQQEIPFVLIANCIPVKGANQSLICDLQRNNIVHIPNDLYDIIIKFEGETLHEIKSYYKNIYDDTIQEYFEFLYDNEFIIFTKTPNLFPKIALDWHEPSQISNAIIDINESSKYNVEKVIEQLNEINCKYLELRFFKSTNLNELSRLANFLDNLKSSIISIDFNMPFQQGFDELSLFSFISEFPRISSFRIHSSPFDKFIPPKKAQSGYIIYSQQKVKNEKFCGIVDTSLFAINIKTFTESQNHNSCLNRKISIDVEGNIKNCPSMAQSFGNIKDTTLQEVLQQKEFKKYWNITKDEISICKECEFRYICTDCRAYTENPKDNYSKPLKCGYSPYTNEWSDWSTNPLKQKAIEYYDLKGLI